MDINGFRAITPFITLAMTLGVGVIGWLIRKLIAQNLQSFADLKTEFKELIDEKSADLGKRMDKLEKDLDKLQTSRLTDQKYLYERFVSKEGFYHTVGKTESSIGRIFKLIHELNRSLTSRSPSPASHE